MSRNGQLLPDERPASQFEKCPDSDGPFLILAAFWQATDNTDEVADALRESDFPTPEGFDRGQVVAFRYEVADSLPFRRDLARLDLAELNTRKPAR